MDNQHKQIKGYRDLSQEEIDLMNEVKEKGAELEALIAKIEQTVPVRGSEDQSGADGRWVSIARTQLQQGIMALVRSVAKPDSF